MQPSEPRAQVLVSVVADPTTDTFMLDHAFRVVHHGVGGFETALAPGLYKLRFRSGLATEERHLEVHADASPQPIVVKAPALAFNSPAPLRGTQRASGDQLGEAERISAGAPALVAGRGSQMFLFVRREVEGEGAEPSDALEGVTLHKLDGTKVADLSALAVRAAGCAGLLLELEPGAYRLHCPSQQGALEQIVATALGWQTQIFAWKTGATEDQDATVSLANASVLMARHPFRSDDNMLRCADAARIALGRRRVVMPRRLLDTFLDEKFENPMLGLYAAEAIRASAGQAPSENAEWQADQDTLHRVLLALLRLIPEHPDVQALASILGPATPLAVPPTLRTLWSTLVERSLEDQSQLIQGSLAARIPSTVVEGTPWLIWLEDALLPLDSGGPATVQLQGIYNAMESLGFDEDALEQLNLTGTEASLLSFLDRRSRLEKGERGVTMAPLEERGIAKAFRTTISDVESVVHGLAGKLRAGKVKF